MSITQLKISLLVMTHYIKDQTTMLDYSYPAYNEQFYVEEVKRGTPSMESFFIDRFEYSLGIAKAKISLGLPIDIKRHFRFHLNNHQRIIISKLINVY